MREYIYAARCGEFVKIGRTQDLHRRMRELNSKRPGAHFPPGLEPGDVPVVLAGWLWGGIEVEVALQDAFADYHVHGEWFAWNALLAAWCARRAQNMPLRPGEPVVL